MWLLRKTKVKEVRTCYWDPTQRVSVFIKNTRQPKALPERFNPSVPVQTNHGQVLMWASRSPVCGRPAALRTSNTMNWNETGAGHGSASKESAPALRSVMTHTGKKEAAVYVLQSRLEPSTVAELGLRGTTETGATNRSHWCRPALLTITDNSSTPRMRYVFQSRDTWGAYVFYFHFSLSAASAQAVLCGGVGNG